jgi:hypothetical protein
MLTFRVALLIFVFLLLAASLQAQLRSGAEPVSMTANLPGSIELNASRMRVSIRVTKSEQIEAVVPIEAKWNLDPNIAQSFQVVASFGERGAALASPNANVAAQDVELGMEQGYRPMNQSKRRLVLLNVYVNRSRRQGTVKRTLAIRIKRERLSALPDGVYNGWLSLEAVQQ